MALEKKRYWKYISIVFVGLLGVACGSRQIPQETTSETIEPTTTATPGKPTLADLKNLVKRSWQYVAMYNVNTKGALRYGGWNVCDVDTSLKITL